MKNIYWLARDFMLILLVLLGSGCTEDEPIQMQNISFQKLTEQEEFVIREKIITAYDTHCAVSDLLHYMGGCFIYFDDGNNVFFSKARTPLITVDDQGFWRINGLSTCIPSCTLEGVPEIRVGENGHWWIGGLDSGIQRKKDIFPFVKCVVDRKKNLIFVLWDDTSIAFPKRKATPFFRNAQLPRRKDTLRVLALGNSYTLDAIAYLHELSCHAGIDAKRLGVYVACHAGASLEYWSHQYLERKICEISRAAGSVAMQTKGNLQQLLSQPWDVVILQQNSANAIDYKTFTPYLRYLIGKVKECCPNKEVALAWQMAWGYWTGFGGAPYGINRFRMISEVMRTQMETDGIDLLIPIGTAIENARNTELQTSHDLTRDGTHIAHGVGRYIAACTWFESILTPVFGQSIWDNPMLYEVSKEENAQSKYETKSVTPSNRLTCQWCAMHACHQQFKVTVKEVSRK